MVICDMVKGTKLTSTMARPEMLLMDAWVGMSKKYTAAAIMAVAKDKINNSLMIDNIFMMLLYKHTFL